jgi:ABC-type multidrug transport system fused ATPase/permease subunit
MKRESKGGLLDKILNKQLSHFRRMMSYATPTWQFKVVVVLVIMATGLDVIIPTMIGNIVDLISKVSSGKDIATLGGGLLGRWLIPISRWATYHLGYDIRYSTIGVYIATSVALALVVTLLNYLVRYGCSQVSQRVSYSMRRDMYNSLLEQSFSFYDKQRTGQLMARATNDIEQVERFLDVGLRMMIQFSLVIAVVWVLVSINLSLTILTIITMPFILLTILDFGRRSYPWTQKQRQQYGEITSALQENLSGVRVVRGFAQEEQEEKKINLALENYFSLHLRMAKFRAFYLPLSLLISSLSVLLILWYGGNQVIAGILSIGSLVSFYLLLTRISRPVQQLGMVSNMFLRANAASGRVFETMDSNVSVHDKPDAIELENLEGKVQFDHVFFQYDESNLVLSDINLTVNPGMTVAILGATGSGKSSIINLIPRFYDVTRGTIKIDDHDVRDYTIKSLREHIAIVRQDPFIFSTTFKGNIAYGVDKPKMKDVEDAAKRAKIHDYIISTPKGYDSEIGERGVTVSGGQKQRIAIARALLKNPKILILDDSTSSVDTETEHEIQESLDELIENRTTFIITQRLSSIKKADYIIVLDHGVIGEEGTHEQLMAKNGLYRQLYDTQTGASKGDHMR